MKIIGKANPNQTQTTVLLTEITGLMNRLGFKPNPVAQLNISGTVKQSSGQPLGAHLKGVRSGGNVDCTVYTNEGAFEGFLILDRTKGVTSEQIMAKYRTLPAARKASPPPVTQRKNSPSKRVGITKPGFVNASSIGGTRIPGYKGRRVFSSPEEHDSALKLAGHQDTIRRAQVTLDILIEERKKSERMKATYEGIRNRNPSRQGELTLSIQTLIGEISVTSMNIETQQRIIEHAQRAIDQLD